MLYALAEAGQSATEILDIVKNVHDFYDDSWRSLLWAVGIVFLVSAAIVGVLMPWWLEYSRRKTFEIDRDAMLKRIQEMRLEIQGEVEAELEIFDDNLQQALERMSESEKAAKKDLQQSQVAMCARQARALADAGDHVTDIKWHIISVDLGLEADMGPEWWHHELKAILEWLQNPHNCGAIKGDENAIKVLERVVTTLEGTEPGKKCKISLDKIKEFLPSC
ncbi:MAG: hypothetical protein WBD75_01995 [Phycisphaerae bacterium]